jgi:hypothetical protein
VKARGHFPTEQAAIKCPYLVTRSLDPTGTGGTRDRNRPLNWVELRWFDSPDLLHAMHTGFV